MNYLATISDSKFNNIEDMLRRNREQYPEAYYPKDDPNKPHFILSDFILNYCVEEYDGEEWGYWLRDIAECQSMLRPESKITNRGYPYEDGSVGFFGMPPRVQEGILIFIHEFFAKHNPYRDDDFYSASSDLYFMSLDLFKSVMEKPDDYGSMSEEEKEQYLDDQVMGWEDFKSYNGHYSSTGLEFFSGEDSIIFYAQLAAHMGFSVTMDSLFYDETGFSAADELLDAMAIWEGYGRGAEFNGPKSSYHTDTVIVINSPQAIVSGNTEVASYMREVFNHSPWQHDLRGIMDEYSEYFPEKDEPIRVDAYARVGDD